MLCFTHVKEWPWSTVFVVFVVCCGFGHHEDQFVRLMLVWLLS